MNKLNLKFLNFIGTKNLLFYLTVIASLFVTSNLSNILVSKITLNLGQKIGIYLNKHIFIELLTKITTTTQIPILQK